MSEHDKQAREKDTTRDADWRAPPLNIADLVRERRTLREAVDEAMKRHNAKLSGPP